MSALLETLVRDTAIDTDRVPVGRQLISFVIVGGSGAACFIGLSSLAIGLHTGIANWIVSALCYAVLIGPVYLMHRRFSFGSEAPHGHALPRYVAVQLSALALASLFSFILYGFFGLPTVLASLLVTGLTSGVNFMILRLWAFAGVH